MRRLMRSAIALVLMVALAVPADASRTLDQIKARGTLRCGVGDGLPGLAALDGAGRWVGLDADFCRALAAAVLNDADKVTFVPLRSAERFPALRLDRIDVLVRNTTWTLAREAGFNVLFADRKSVV